MSLADAAVEVQQQQQQAEEPKEAKTIPKAHESAGEEEVKVQEATQTASEETHAEPTATAEPATEATEAAAPTAVAAETPQPLDCWAPYPVEYDGWVMSHNAIRLDLDDFARLLNETLPAHFAAGKMQPWMGDNLVEWYDHIYALIHEHHDHEEEIFFPEMNKRVTVPPKMTADHKTLMQLLDRSVTETKALAEAIKASRPVEELEPLRATLAATASTLSAEMREHLTEEEEIGLPLFRANFTKKEANKIEAKILKTIKPIFLGNFLRPLKEDDRRVWMKKYGNIPAPVIHFILWPKAKDGGAYYQKYVRLYDEIATAERIPKKGSGNCSIM